MAGVGGVVERKCRQLYLNNKKKSKNKKKKENKLVLSILRRALSFCLYHFSNWLN